MHQNKEVTKIAITGTKGKTSIARIIDFVLRKQNKKTLRVDTDGYFHNGILFKSRKEILRETGALPTVSAGRILQSERAQTVDVAVLEQSLSSGKKENELGYERHDIAVFSNILADHIDYKTIHSQDDIYTLKRNIVGKVAPDGWIIANFDDMYGRKLRYDLGHKNFFFYGFGKKIIEQENYLTIRDHHYELKLDAKVEQFPLIEMPFPFDFRFQVVFSNVLAAIACMKILQYNVNDVLSALSTYTIDETLGRLVLKEIHGKKILFDNTHDPHSLIEVGKYCKKIGKKLIGVLRLSPERTDKAIAQFGKTVAQKNIFDEIIIYDFIDGKHASKSVSKPHGRSRSIGEVATLLVESLKNNLGSTIPVNKILNEQDALLTAIDRANPGDVILMIQHHFQEDIDLLASL